MSTRKTKLVLSSHNIHTISGMSAEVFIKEIKTYEVQWWPLLGDMCHHCGHHIHLWWPIFIQDAQDYPDRYNVKDLVQRNSEQLKKYCSSYKHVWGKYITCSNI